MSELILSIESDGIIREHHVVTFNSLNGSSVKTIFFQNNDKKPCVQVRRDVENATLSMSYYIGTDWLIENEQAIYVAPKVNNLGQQVDYLGMLHASLSHVDALSHAKELYEIKLNQPFIEVDQQMDLITPLIMLQFLHTLKHIVIKGLKKSYYKVEHNLASKIKGRVLTSKNIKKNLVQNKPINTYCQHDEFGLDSIENRVLNHTLSFVRRYFAKYPAYNKLTKSLIDFCTPAFENVADKVDLKALKQTKYNSFYKEYKQALDLSKIIFKRFGYHISEVESTNSSRVSVPPFWIDMSKLFELYVLSLLKDKYGNKIVFQAKGNYGEPDFLLLEDNTPLIMDAKYNPLYQNHDYNSDDIRQISGYARDHKILNRLGFATQAERENNVVGCVIIYTDQSGKKELPETLTETPIEQFTKFYKVPIAMPVLRTS